MALSDTWHKRARLLRPRRGGGPRTTSPTGRARARGASSRTATASGPTCAGSSAPPPRRDRRHLRRRAPRRGRRQTRVLRPVENGRPAADVQVHLVVPKNFNDAQQIADQFKDAIPVILNLQGTDTDLSKRLIDFASGLTYALDGGMQRIADKVFLLTPRNVEVSAEERARLIEKGFFNQSLGGRSGRRMLRAGMSSGSSVQATWPPRLRAAGASPCSSPTSTRRGPQALASELGGEALGVERRRGGARRRACVLCHKPAQLERGGRGDRAAGRRRSSRSSAATPLADVEARLPGPAVYRFMPNIPAEVGQGVFCYAPGTPRRRGPEQERARPVRPLGTGRASCHERADRRRHGPDGLRPGLLRARGGGARRRGRARTA